ncbi:MAG: D-alanine aminotransferase [Nitrospirales bacterium]|nr:MAG: D-alanine aminotransferase [Nitrospirales bacterium]
MPNIGYLNGQFMPLEQVCVSAEDRGYQFGDGIYEVIRTYQGCLFYLEEHLARLERNAREIHIALPLNRHEWEAAILLGVKQSGYANCKVYLQVTRGAAPREHQFPAALSPTVLMTFREMPDFDAHLRAKGVSAITLPDIRWGRCDIKSLNLLPNVLAKQKAAEAGAFEAIFVRDDIVTEGASSNFMIVKDGVISSSELNQRILAGVTLLCVIELARVHGYDVQERVIRARELDNVDEMFLVGTTIEVLPVTQLNDQPVGDGSPGPVTRSLMSKFSETVEKTFSIPLR